MVTIFTSTYNRAGLLNRLYDSLCKQTNKNFEWLVVDDGSSDETELLIKSWIKEDKIEIRYYKQDNGGKHRAINFGVLIAKGEYFLILDSDDWLRADAVEFIYRKSIEIGELSYFCGICGTKVLQDGKLIGSTFNGEYVDAYIYERRKNRILGDKSEIFITKILQQFPFPEIEGEKFCPEALVWNRIGEAGYKMRYYNEGIYFCEYQDSGLSNNIDRLLIKNFKAYSIYAKELLTSKYFSRVEKFSCLCNLVRRARLNGYSYLCIRSEYGIGYIYLLFCNMIANLVYFRRGK